jgi:hypothetical protein
MLAVDLSKNKKIAKAGVFCILDTTDAPVF